VLDIIIVTTRKKEKAVFVCLTKVHKAKKKKEKKTMGLLP